VHTDRLGGPAGKNDAGTALMRSRIIDRYGNRLTGLRILNDDAGAEWQCAMGSGETVALKWLATRGAASGSIPGGEGETARAETRRG